MTSYETPCTPYSTHLQKTVSWLIKKCRPAPTYNLKARYRVHRSLSWTSLIHIFLPYLFLSSILILSSSLHLRLSRGLFSSLVPIKILYKVFSSLLCVLLAPPIWSSSFFARIRDVAPRDAVFSGQLSHPFSHRSRCSQHSIFLYSLNIT